MLERETCFSWISLRSSLAKNRTARRGARTVSRDSEGGTHVIRLAGGRTPYVVADRGRRPGNLDDQERKRRSCSALFLGSCA